MSDARPRIGRIGAIRARREGVIAALDGATAEDCPYLVGGNYEQRVKARYWMRGWARTTLAMRQRATLIADRATQTP